MHFCRMSAKGHLCCMRQLKSEYNLLLAFVLVSHVTRIVVSHTACQFYTSEDVFFFFFFLWMCPTKDIRTMQCLIISYTKAQLHALISFVIKRSFHPHDSTIKIQRKPMYFFKRNLCSWITHPGLAVEPGTNAFPEWSLYHPS